MNQTITFVQIVSDGIVVRFSDGKFTYFGLDFLLKSVGIGSNQVLLDYDPSVELPLATIKSELIQ